MTGLSPGLPKPRLLLLTLQAVLPRVRECDFSLDPPNLEGLNTFAFLKDKVALESNTTGWPQKMEPERK